MPTVDEEIYPPEVRELRRALHDSGMTRLQLSEKTGVPLGTIYGILAAHQSTPHRTNVLREFFKLAPLPVDPQKRRRQLRPLKPAVETPAPTPAPVVEFIDPSLESAEPLLHEEAKATLIRHLKDAQESMLEARGALAQTYGRESKQDRHITAALRSIGELRFAVNEGDL